MENLEKLISSGVGAFEDPNVQNCFKAFKNEQDLMRMIRKVTSKELKDIILHIVKSTVKQGTNVAENNNGESKHQAGKKSAVDEKSAKVDEIEKEKQVLELKLKVERRNKEQIEEALKNELENVKNEKEQELNKKIQEFQAQLEKEKEAAKNFSQENNKVQLNRLKEDLSKQKRVSAEEMDQLQQIIMTLKTENASWESSCQGKIDEVKALLNGKLKVNESNHEKELRNLSDQIVTKVESAKSESYKQLKQEFEMKEKEMKTEKELFHDQKEKFDEENSKLGEQNSANQDTILWLQNKMVEDKKAFDLKVRASKEEHSTERQRYEQKMLDMEKSAKNELESLKNAKHRELEDKISELQKQLKENEIAKESLQNLQHNSTVGKDQISPLSEDFAKQKQDYTAEINQLQQKMNMLKTESELLELSCQKKDEKLQAEESKHDAEIKALTDQMTTREEAAKIELDSLKNAKDRELDDKICELQKQLKENEIAKESLQNLQQDRTVGKSQISQLSEDFAKQKQDHTEQLNRLQQQMNALKTESELLELNCQKKGEKLKAQESKYEEEIKALSDQMATIKSASAEELVCLKKRYEEKEREVAESNNVEKQLHEQLKQMEEKVKHYEQDNCQNVDKLETKMKEEIKLMDTIQAKQEELEAERKLHEQEVLDMKESSSKAIENLTNAKNQELMDKVDEFQKQLKKEEEMAKESLETLHQENAASQVQINQLTEDLVKQKQESAQQLKTFEEKEMILKTENKSLEATCQEKLEEIKAAFKKTQDIESKYEAEMKTLTTLRSQWEEEKNILDEENSANKNLILELQVKMKEQANAFGAMIETSKAELGSEKQRHEQQILGMEESLESLRKVEDQELNDKITKFETQMVATVESLKSESSDQLNNQKCEFEEKEKEMTARIVAEQQLQQQQLQKWGEERAKWDEQNSKNETVILEMQAKMSAEKPLVIEIQPFKEELEIEKQKYEQKIIHLEKSSKITLEGLKVQEQEQRTKINELQEQLEKNEELSKDESFHQKTISQEQISQLNEDMVRRRQEVAEEINQLQQKIVSLESETEASQLFWREKIEQMKVFGDEKLKIEELKHEVEMKALTTEMESRMAAPSSDDYEQLTNQIKQYENKENEMSEAMNTEKQFIQHKMQKWEEEKAKWEEQDTSQHSTILALQTKMKEVEIAFATHIENSKEELVAQKQKQEQKMLSMMELTKNALESLKHVKDKELKDKVNELQKQLENKEELVNQSLEIHQENIASKNASNRLREDFEKQQQASAEQLNELQQKILALKTENDSLDLKYHEEIEVKQILNDKLQAEESKHETEIRLLTGQTTAKFDVLKSESCEELSSAKDQYEGKEKEMLQSMNAEKQLFQHQVKQWEEEKSQLHEQNFNNQNTIHELQMKIECFQKTLEENTVDKNQIAQLREDLENQKEAAAEQDQLHEVIETLESEKKSLVTNYREKFEELKAVLNEEVKVEKMKREKEVRALTDEMADKVESLQFEREHQLSCLKDQEEEKEKEARESINAEKQVLHEQTKEWEEVKANLDRQNASNHDTIIELQNKLRELEKTCESKIEASKDELEESTINALESLKHAKDQELKSKLELQKELEINQLAQESLDNLHQENDANKNLSNRLREDLEKQKQDYAEQAREFEQKTLALETENNSLKLNYIEKVGSIEQILNEKLQAEQDKHQAELKVLTDELTNNLKSLKFEGNNEQLDNQKRQYVLKEKELNEKMNALELNYQEKIGEMKQKTNERLQAEEAKHRAEIKALTDHMTNQLESLKFDGNNEQLGNCQQHDVDKEINEKMNAEKNLQEQLKQLEEEKIHWNDLLSMNQSTIDKLQIRMENVEKASKVKIQAFKEKLEIERQEHEERMSDRLNGEKRLLRQQLEQWEGEKVKWDALTEDWTKQTHVSLEQLLQLQNEIASLQDKMVIKAGGDEKCEASTASKHEVVDINGNVFKTLAKEIQTQDVVGGGGGGGGDGGDGHVCDVRFEQMYEAKVKSLQDRLKTYIKSLQDSLNTERTNAREMHSKVSESSSRIATLESRNATTLQRLREVEDVGRGAAAEIARKDAEIARNLGTIENMTKDRLELMEVKSALDFDGEEVKSALDEVKSAPDFDREEVKSAPDFDREEVKSAPDLDREEVKSAPDFDREEVKSAPDLDGEEVKSAPDLDGEGVKRALELEISSRADEAAASVRGRKRPHVEDEAGGAAAGRTNETAGGAADGRINEAADETAAGRTNAQKHFKSEPELDQSISNASVAKDQPCAIM